MCLYMCVHVKMLWSPEGGIRSFELELQAFMSHLTWVLGLEFWSFDKALGALRPPTQAVLTAVWCCSVWAPYTFKAVSVGEC